MSLSKKILRFYILNRLLIAGLLIVAGILFHLYVDTVMAWLCYIFAFISIVLYFTIGTMRLVQEAVTEGDVDAAVAYIKMIKYPRLLFKPVRSAYYMLQSNFSLATEDFSTAEENIKKSLKTKSKMVGDTEGISLMQLGFIQIKKGNYKEARVTLQEALKAGLPDKESRAATYLQLCSLEIQRNQNRIAKEYFKKAKAQNPRSEEIVKQIKMMEKQITRMPG